MDKGLIPGGESTSHNSGNDILYTIQETGQQVLIEGDEYHLCKAALMSSEIHEYKDKTNKEILEDIYTRSSCMVKEGEANVGDFIVCKLAVRDEEKRNLTGTIAEIVSIMQKEHGCRVVDGAEYEKMKKGGYVELSKTPAPKKERIYGSKTNPKGTSATGDSAKSIKFSESTLDTIKNKVDEHNQKHPDKKVTLEIAKAVVRRGMGAYSSTHRPTIKGGKPNSRVAWGLARLNAFLYKAVKGSSKSGKYSQDNDLLDELGIKHRQFEDGGTLDANNEVSTLEVSTLQLSILEDGGSVEGFQPPYEINEAGGYKYTGKAKETAKKVDLLSLPRNVDGTHCGNCFFQEQGICVHKQIMLPVTDRMCCAVWDNSNSERSYEKNLQKDKGKLPDNVEQFPKNEGGGYTYSGKALEIAETFDLITLPKKIEGTNCSNCGWFSPYKDGGFCFRTNIWLPVTARMSCAYWNSLSVDRDWGILKEGGKITDEQNETYKEWRTLVNMSAKELQSFYETEEGKEAGLKRKEAADLGIRYGRESARWIIKMKQTPKNKWSDKMWEWADRQISFIKRMSGNKGELFDEKGNKTRKHTALLIWGHNPLKKSKMSKGGSISDGYNLLDISKIHKIKYSDIVKEFKKGIKYELRFTDKPAVAMEVAKDNLLINPNYYSIIFKMENGGLIEEVLGQNFYIAARHLFKIELASRGLYLLPNDKFMVDGKFYSVQFFIEKDEKNKVYSAEYIVMESPIQDQDKVREFFDLIQEDIKDRPLNQIMVDDLYDKDVEEWDDKDFENYKYLLVTYRDKVDDIDEYEMQDKYITSGAFDMDIFDFDYLPLEYFLQGEVGTLYGGEIFAKYSEEEILNSIYEYKEDFKLLKYLASRMSWNDFLQAMTSENSIYSRFGKAFLLSKNENLKEDYLTYNDVNNVSGVEVKVYALVNKDKKLNIGLYAFEDSKSAMKFVLSNKMSRAEIKVFKVNSNDLIVYDIEQITTYIYSPLMLREYVVSLKSFWESLN